MNKKMSKLTKVIVLSLFIMSLPILYNGSVKFGTYKGLLPISYYYTFGFITIIFFVREFYLMFKEKGYRK